MNCLICGHKGDKKNPLALQGTYTVPYCCHCMKIAEMNAARAIIKEKEE